jgi:hypothetical protein
MRGILQHTIAILFILSSPSMLASWVEESQPESLECYEKLLEKGLVKEDWQTTPAGAKLQTIEIHSQQLLITKSPSGAILHVGMNLSAMQWPANKPKEILLKLERLFAQSILDVQLEPAEKLCYQQRCSNLPWKMFPSLGQGSTPIEMSFVLNKSLVRGHLLFADESQLNFQFPNNIFAISGQSKLTLENLLEQKLANILAGCSSQNPPLAEKAVTPLSKADIATETAPHPYRKSFGETIYTATIKGENVPVFSAAYPIETTMNAAQNFVPSAIELQLTHAKYRDTTKPASITFACLHKLFPSNQYLCYISLEIQTPTLLKFTLLFENREIPYGHLIEVSIPMHNEQISTPSRALLHSYIPFHNEKPRTVQTN